MNGHDETPEGHIANVAWLHVARNEKNGCHTHLPALREELTPHIRLAILTEVLKAVQKHGSYQEALKIVNEMESLKREIAARKSP